MWMVFGLLLKNLAGVFNALSDYAELLRDLTDGL
jgi:hypothetical protein